jgi:LacI family transcriptional regulator
MSEKTRLTIDQIALLAGVSRSVVSRVLNNRSRVSSDARGRVLEVIEKYNYRPSSVARSLATDRVFEICIVTPRRRNEAIANGFWPLLHLGISEQCIERGYFVSLTMISPDTADEIYDRILNERIFDGYILITQEVTQTMVPRLQSRSVPMVLIGQDPSFPDVNWIDVDNFDGAYKATAHLIELGYTEIAVILANMHLQESIDRYHGYAQALTDAGLVMPEARAFVSTYSEESGYETMKRWIEQSALPPAIFCASDSIATGVLLALYRAGVAVPDEVAVVGFDDVPNARYTAPPLTTIHQPIYEKGQRAANIIIDQIEGVHSDVVHVMLPADLIVRDSCGAAGAAVRVSGSLTRTNRAG